MTDPNREDGRNAISFELIMNHTALAIICLHIIGLVMCGERFPFTVWSKRTLSPIPLKRLLAVRGERVIVLLITVFSLCLLSPNSSNYFVEKFESELLMPVKAASLTLLTPEPEVLYLQRSLKGHQKVSAKAYRIWYLWLSIIDPMLFPRRPKGIFPLN